MSKAKLGTISKRAGKVLVMAAVALQAMPAVAEQAKKSKPATSSSSGKKVGKGCNASAQAAAQNLLDEIQQTRVNDDRATVSLVDAALINPCLVVKRPLLVRIGIAAACNAKMQLKVRHFFELANREAMLIQACPEFLP
jgi:hypothetical protein